MRKYNKKGDMYAITLLVLTLMGLFFISYRLNEKNRVQDEFGDDRNIGEFQSAIFAAIQQGEAALLYVDQAAKYALETSSDQFSEFGGEYVAPGEGSDSMLEAEEPRCGRFVYNKWSTANEFCPPLNPEENYGEFVDVNMNGYFEKAEFPFAIPLDNYDFKIEEKEEGFYLTGIAKRPIVIDIITKTFHEKFDGEVSWPVTNNRVTSCYGKRNLDGQAPSFHYGLDFTQYGNSEVMSIASGTVMQVCNKQPRNTYSDCENCPNPCGKQGNYVTVKHSEGFYSRYSHLEYNSIKVGLGKRVHRGDTLGILGNTGRSTAPHLDIKTFTSAPVGKISDTDVVNPLCFYKPEQLAELRVSLDAQSCFDIFGDPPPIQKGYFKRETIEGDCKKINYDKLNEEFGQTDKSLPKYEERHVGTYEVMPHFKVKTNIPLPKPDYKLKEVVDWAEETWESCEESPAACLESHKEEYNNDSDSKYELKEAVECEEDEFFYRIIETFEVCLESKEPGCFCELELNKITNRDYTIKFEGNKIIMTEPEERIYEFHDLVNYFSYNPSNPEGWQKTLEIIKKGNLIELNHDQDKIEYEKLKLYKPNAEKVVLIADDTGISDCADVRKTFLVCAESKELYTFKDETGKEIQKPEQTRFALELRDKVPVVPAGNVEMEQAEESQEDNSKKAQEEIIEQGLNMIYPGLGTLLRIIKEILEALEEATAAFYINIEIPENADVSGFEIHCNLDKALKKDELGNPDKFVGVNNPYLDTLKGDVEEAKRNLDYDVERIETVTKQHGDTFCDYVKLMGADGQVRFVKKTNAMQANNKVSFLAGACGDDILTQLKSAISPLYCITIVPVDSRGNKGKPIVKCDQFQALQDRILEWLGYSEITDSYIAITKDVEKMLSAIETKDFSEIVKVIGNEDLAKKLEEWGIGENFKETIVNKALDEVRENINLPDFKEGVKAVLETAKEKAKFLDDFLEDSNIAEDLKQKARETAIDLMDSVQQRELLDALIGDLGSLSEQAQYKIVGALLGKHFDINEKIALLKKTIEDSGNLREIISELVNQNQRDGIDVLNEIGLTELQTHDVFDRTLQGFYGLIAQRALMRSMLPDIEDGELRAMLDQLKGLEFDEKLTEIITQEISDLAEESKAFIMDNIIDELPQDAFRDLMKSLGIDSREQLFAYLKDRYGDEIRDAVNEATNGLFGFFDCPENPWDVCEDAKCIIR